MFSRCFRLYRADRILVQKVNNDLESLWTARVYDSFEGISLAEVRQLCVVLDSRNSGLAANRVSKARALLGAKTYSKPRTAFAQHKQRLHRPHQHHRKRSRSRKHTQAVDERRTHHRKLPKHKDWRNHKGFNYDSPIRYLESTSSGRRRDRVHVDRNQGHCGSCYAVSTLAALEARMRIASSRRVHTLLSPQDVLCSSYTEGCKGGYSYLVAKVGSAGG